MIDSGMKVKNRGFTLVEMILAIFLVGVLTVFSVLTFMSVSNGWQASTDYMDKMQRTDYALNQVISGLRSMYYPHNGKTDGKYGFCLTDNGDGDDPDRSDVIEWSKTGNAIVGTKNQIGSTVHRVQLRVLEEGDTDWGRTPIQKTGLYARFSGDSSLLGQTDDDDTDYTFANEELYEPVLIADGIVGMNCRVIKKVEDLEKDLKDNGENDKEVFEDEFAESNSVPYKIELTFFVEKQDEEFLSRTERAPIVRIIRIPIHEQSLDGAEPPSEDQQKEGTKKDSSSTSGGKSTGGASGGGASGGGASGGGTSGGGRPGGGGLMPPGGGGGPR